MRLKSYLLAKFGKKEHLEDLKDGRIFFNAVKNYRNDGTDYRGDYMEGRIPINPATIAIYDRDGKNIFDYVSRPQRVIQSLLGDDNFLMFCASALTEDVMVEKEKGHWILIREYEEKIRQFGEYVLLFWSYEFLEKIKEAQKNHIPKFGYDAGIVKYRDLFDFTDTSAYRTTGRITDRYFVKDLSYKMQNEWRMIIGGEHEALELNEFGGYFINSTPFQYALLMETEKFLQNKD